MVEHDVPDPTGRTWLGALAVLVAAGGLTATAGLAGLAGGVLVAAAWWLLPLPHAVALGFVVLAAVTPAAAPLERLAPASLGLLGLLFAPLPRSENPLPDALVLALVLLVLLGVPGLAFAWGATLPVAALALLAVASLLAYAVHRIELLRLGLLEVTES